MLQGKKEKKWVQGKGFLEEDTPIDMSYRKKKSEFSLVCSFHLVGFIGVLYVCGLIIFLNRSTLQLDDENLKMQNRNTNNITVSLCR